MVRPLARLRWLLAAFFSRVMRTSLARRVVLPVFPRLHLGLFRLTRGRINITELLVPTLMLHTTGAKTGLDRIHPLMCWPDRDGSYLVSGSNWGLPRHPAWTANLLAHPRATVEIGRRRIDVQARLLDGDEREAVWPLLEAHFPDYRAYEHAAGHSIRIFRLTPVARRQ